MNWFKVIFNRSAGTLFLLGLCSACVHTNQPSDLIHPLKLPVLSAIHSMVEAEAALQEIVKVRASIEVRYSQAERICYDKFFVNSCLIDAREQRRVDLELVKKSEVAANYFKRKTRVDEMDRTLEEKRLAHPLPTDK